MQTIKRFIPRRLVRVVKSVTPESWLVAHTAKTWTKKDPAEWPRHAVSQRQGLERYECSLHSQNGEDGILRFLFSKIGFVSRKSLEFGFGPTQCNSLRLVLVENFKGIFIDGNERNVSRFNQAARSIGITRALAVHRFLSLENIERTIEESGLKGEIDLLVIDVDGNDYWFWNEIECVSPRVVVIEYNASLGPELSLTVPYDPTFQRFQKHSSGLYCGASLTALARLAARKGYSLVGCDSNGVNAFFIRNDCLVPGIEPKTPQVAHRDHQQRLQRGLSTQSQYNAIKDLPYIEVTDQGP